MALDGNKEKLLIKQRANVQENIVGLLEGTAASTEQILDTATTNSLYLDLQYCKLC